MFTTHLRLRIVLTFFHSILYLGALQKRYRTAIHSWMPWNWVSMAKIIQFRIIGFIRFYPIFDGLILIFAHISVGRIWIFEAPVLLARSDGRIIIIMFRSRILLCDGSTIQPCYTGKITHFPPCFCLPQMETPMVHIFVLAPGGFSVRLPQCAIWQPAGDSSDRSDSLKPLMNHWIELGIWRFFITETYVDWFTLGTGWLHSYIMCMCNFCSWWAHP